MRDPRPGVVAEVGIACLPPGELALFLVAQREAEHDMGALDRVGEDLVVIGHRLEARHERIVGRDVLGVLDDARRRRAVGIDKQQIGGDDGRAHFVEPVDELREQGARPRPLPKALQAVVVDIDDANRCRLVLPRPEPDVLVEDVQPELREHRRLCEPADKGGRQNGQRDEMMKVAIKITAKQLHSVTSLPKIM